MIYSAVRRHHQVRNAAVFVSLSIQPPAGPRMGGFEVVRRDREPAGVFGRRFWAER